MSASGGKADMAIAQCEMSAKDPKQTSRLREPLVAWVFPAVATCS